MTNKETRTCAITVVISLLLIVFSCSYAKTQIDSPILYRAIQFIAHLSGIIFSASFSILLMADEKQDDYLKEETEYMKYLKHRDEAMCKWAKEQEKKQSHE